MSNPARDIEDVGNQYENLDDLNQEPPPPHSASRNGSQSAKPSDSSKKPAKEKTPLKEKKKLDKKSPLKEKKLDKKSPPKVQPKVDLIEEGGAPLINEVYFCCCFVYIQNALFFAGLFTMILLFLLRIPMVILSKTEYGPCYPLVNTSGISTTASTLKSDFFIHAFPYVEVPALVSGVFAVLFVLAGAYARKTFLVFLAIIFMNLTGIVFLFEIAFTVGYFIEVASRIQCTFCYYYWVLPTCMWIYSLMNIAWLIYCVILCIIARRVMANENKWFAEEASKRVPGSDRINSPRRKVSRREEKGGGGDGRKRNGKNAQSV